MALPSFAPETTFAVSLPAGSDDQTSTALPRREPTAVRRVVLPRTSTGGSRRSTNAWASQRGAERAQRTHKAGIRRRDTATSRRAIVTGGDCAWGFRPRLLTDAPSGLKTGQCVCPLQAPKGRPLIARGREPQAAEAGHFIRYVLARGRRGRYLCRQVIVQHRRTDCTRDPPKKPPAWLSPPPPQRTPTMLNLFNPAGPAASSTAASCCASAACRWPG